MTPQRESYDVVVVGAGVIGLSCAWRAAQRGLSVALIERDEPGAGASGVAAGMLAPVTEAGYGEQRLLELNLASAELWPEFAREVEHEAGLPTGYRSGGALVVARDRDEAEELRRLHEFQRSLDLEADWLSARECRRLEPALSPAVAGGILAPQDSHVDPAALVEALLSSLERAGGRLVAGAGEVEVVHDGEAVGGVRSPAGAIAAEQVVLATGAWSGQVAAVDPPPVRPVKGQILELRTRAGAAPPAERLIRTPRCYLVSRADGRVALGATVEELGFDRAVTAGGVFELLEAARKILPDLDELELVELRAGLRPGTPDNIPVVGSGSLDGLLWATGHYRNGVLLAPLTAASVAALLSGADEPSAMLELCSPARFARAPVPERV